MNIAYQKWVPLILLLFYFHGSISSPHSKLIHRNEMTQMTVQCLKRAAEILFRSPFDFYIIANKNFANDVLYRLFYANYTLLTKTHVTYKNSKRKYIVIEENLEELKNLFNRSSFSKLSKYLILMKSSLKELSEFATYLFKKEFYHVAFFLIDEKGEVSLNQYDARMSEKNHTVMITTAHCNDKFLRNRDKGKVRPFSELICPINGCKLSTWRLRTDTPTDMIYWKDKTGRNVTASFIYNIIESFAKTYDIQLMNSLSETDYDKKWEEAADAIVNGIVDIVFGFNFPDAKVVERLGIITWSR